VSDSQGTTWICLELPEVPVDQREVAATMAPDTVRTAAPTKGMKKQWCVARRRGYQRGRASIPGAGLEPAHPRG
jgi:hypothetical protein